MDSNKYDPNGMPEPGQTVKFFTMIHKRKPLEIGTGTIVKVIRYQKNYPQSKLWYIMGIIIKPDVPFCNSDWIFRELSDLPYK